MSQKLPANGFEWVKKLSKFDEHFIKDYDQNSDMVYFIEVDVEYPKGKSENVISLFAPSTTKKTMLFT